MLTAPKKRRFCLGLSVLVFSINGCGYFAASAINDFSGNIQRVMLESNDPETVAAAIPAYLLLQEARLRSDPDNDDLLMSAAKLNSAYAGMLREQESMRFQRLVDKAMGQVSHAVCLRDSTFCRLQQLPFQEFATTIKYTGPADMDSLFTLGTVWVNWIQAHKSDWNAVAQLAQVKLLMKHVVTLDDNYKEGEAYVYLGVLESLLPPALGGNPELAKHYFDKARVLSADQNLWVLVLYAQHYARMMFDRALHDHLLNVVIAAQPKRSDLTLTNTLAQKRAAELLQSADDYF